MKISKHLVSADILCSFIPGLSTITNTINMITLTILKISKKGSSNPYVKHLKNKGYLGCVVCSIPVVGSPLFLAGRIIRTVLKENSSRASEDIH